MLGNYEKNPWVALSLQKSTQTQWPGGMGAVGKLHPCDPKNRGLMAADFPDSPRISSSGTLHFDFHLSMFCLFLLKPMTTNRQH